jgi:hypothetical protein
MNATNTVKKAQTTYSISATIKHPAHNVSGKDKIYTS